MATLFDPQIEKDNLAQHGISLTEADGVLRDPLALTMEDQNADGEQRCVTLGMNLFGFLRVVVWSPRGDDRRIISVRKANRLEARIYEKK
ncbi:MAG TPA: BrnT family toxin [Candidatus Binatia bacterium]